MSFNDHSRWELLTTLMSDGFFVIQDYKYIYVNPSFEALLGAKPDELLGQRFEQFIHPEAREQVVSRYEDRLKGLSVPSHYEVSLLDVSGSKTILAWLELAVVTDDNEQKIVAGTVRDIGSLQALKKELKTAREQLQTIMDNTSDTIYQTNMAGDVTLISGCVESLLGYSEEEIMGTSLASYYWSPEERQKVVDAITMNNGKVTNVEAVLRRKNGTPVWISTNAYIKKNKKGEPVSIEGVARNVTVQKELEHKLEKLALTDCLTGLPNRRALMDELHAQYTDAKKLNNSLVLIYFDINDFKGVNDNYGHLVGDKLLIHVANRLNDHEVDKGMFGRLSGDEFLFILPEMSLEGAQQLAGQVINDIREKPLTLQQHSLSISLAIGISCLMPEDSSEYSLLDRADKAMFMAKKSNDKYRVL